MESFSTAAIGQLLQFKLVNFNFFYLVSNESTVILINSLILYQIDYLLNQDWRNCKKVNSQTIFFLLILPIECDK